VLLPSDVIVAAVRWYLRFGLPCRDVEEPAAERGVEVEQVAIEGDHGRLTSQRTGGWRSLRARHLARQ
jgi:transposase-like protein